MTETPENPFVKMATAYIDMANQFGREAEQGLVGVAMMHAAARYNAFVSATVLDTAKQMEMTRAEHIDHYVNQFRDFLEQHYDDYVRNYETNLKGVKPAQTPE